MKTWLDEALHSEISRHLLSGDSINEIMMMYSNQLFRNLLKPIKGTFAIMCDGTKDISGCEQDIIFMRFLLILILRKTYLYY